MVIFSLLRLSTILCLLISIIRVNHAKGVKEKYYMDRMCGDDPFILNGDNRPGISFYLTSNSKYKANLNCTVKFRTAQPSQRLIVTIERMNILDCPGDLLKIYDGKKIVNANLERQCGSSASFTFTSSTTQVTMIFTSNTERESSGFKIAIALHFPMIAHCPQNLGFYLCKNKNCISKKLECNGGDHCGDGTDEIQCGFLSG